MRIIRKLIGKACDWVMKKCEQLWNVCRTIKIFFNCDDEGFCPA